MAKEPHPGNDPRFGYSRANERKDFDRSDPGFRTSKPQDPMTKKWWRRGELNPCPKIVNTPHLHV